MNENNADEGAPTKTHTVSASSDSGADQIGPQDGDDEGNSSPGDDSLPIDHEKIVDGQMYRLLVGAISHEVITQLDERRARSRTITLTALSIVAAFSIGIASFLVNELLSIRTSQAVSVAIEDALSEPQFVAELAAFEIRVLALDQQDAFTEEAANELSDNAKRLYLDNVQNERLSTPARQRNAERLRASAELLVEQFAAADRLDLVFALEEIFPELTHSGAVTSVVVQTLGWRLLAEAGAPRT